MHYDLNSIVFDNMTLTALQQKMNADKQTNYLLSTLFSHNVPVYWPLRQADPGFPRGVPTPEMGRQPIITARVRSTTGR